MKGHLHGAAHVYYRNYLLRPFLLVLVDHHVRFAGCGFPVDGLVIVAFDVIAYLVELHLVANLADAFDAGFGEAVTDGHYLVFAHLAICRVNLDTYRPGDATLKEGDGRGVKTTVSGQTDTPRVLLASMCSGGCAPDPIQDNNSKITFFEIVPEISSTMVALMS